MWIIGLAALAFIGYELFLTHFRTKDGIQQFTPHGQKEALKILHTASASIPPAGILVPGAATFQVVQFQPAGLSADGVVNSATAQGAAVFLTKNIFQSDGQPVLIAVTPGNANDAAKHMAGPGGQFALLAPLG